MLWDWFSQGARVEARLRDIRFLSLIKAVEKSDRRGVGSCGLPVAISSMILIVNGRLDGTSDRCESSETGRRPDFGSVMILYSA